MNIENANELSLKESVITYINWKARTIKSARSRYLPRLKELVGFQKEGKTLKELTVEDITDYHMQMEDKGYSLATIALSTRIIRNFIEFWDGRKAVKINPKEIKPPKFLTPEQPVVELEDFELMSESLSDGYTAELQRKLAIHLLWDTGMRVSEMTDLKLSNLNQPSIDGVRSARIKTKKTDRYNLVLWSKETDELLTKYLGWRITQDHPTDYLFIRTDKASNKGLTTKTIERWVKQLAKDTLLGKEITPHSFRHGKAHFILNNGGTAIDVQTVLRHKNLNSSLNYMRLNESKYIDRASRFLTKTKQQIDNFIEKDFKSELVYNSSLVYNAV